MTLTEMERLQREKKAAKKALSQATTREERRALEAQISSLKSAQAKMARDAARRKVIGEQLVPIIAGVSTTTAAIAMTKQQEEQARLKAHRELEEQRAEAEQALSDQMGAAREAQMEAQAQAQKDAQAEETQYQVTWTEGGEETFL